MKMRWLLVLGFLFTALTAHGSPVFTDADARKFLDRWLNDGCSEVLFLGLVLAQVGEKDEYLSRDLRERDQDSWNWYIGGFNTEFMYAMEEQGFIKIDRLWSHPNQKYHEVHVTLTREGESLRKLAAQVHDDIVCVKWGRGRVTHLGRNEELRKGVDVYRVVMAVFDMKWTPEILVHSRLRGDPVAEERKLIALLKHDPFQSKWEMVTYDVANLDEEFKTNKVTTELERR